MKLVFKITAAEARAARSFFDQWAADPFVKKRRDRNVGRKRRSVNRAVFWEALVSALLTTQQRSGPDSPVNRFIASTPFPLTLKACRSHQPPERFILNRITAANGLRRGPTIAGQLGTNLQWLESAGWTSLMPSLRSLEGGTNATQEREAAQTLAAHLLGIGPKQSRNLLQMLGLTRFEIPIDSRISKWLNRFGFPIPLTAAGLSDPGCYELFLDGFQELCRRAGVLPCMMDAAIFASFDKGAWTDSTKTRW